MTASEAAEPGGPAAQPQAELPAGLDLLWGRRGAGKRGPRPGLSADAIVDAAIRLADAEGLEGVSMARVAAEVGFTTMSLYRYVASKEELLQLMWNASAQGAEGLVLEGDGWRARLRMWCAVQRDMLDRHAWLTQMPMAAPPVAPNSLAFVERGLETMDGTPLADVDKLRFIGLISSYTLSEARMANDGFRAARDAAAAAAAAGDGAEAAPPWTFDALLRELADEATYPRLHRIAWTPPGSGAGAGEGAGDGGGADAGSGQGVGGASVSGDGGGAGVGASVNGETVGELVDGGGPPSERDEFLFGIDRILDGIQAYMDRVEPGS
jgi:AcrR family transcriptional regulator